MAAPSNQALAALTILLLNDKIGSESCFSGKSSPKNSSRSRADNRRAKLVEAQRHITHHKCTDYPLTSAFDRRALASW